MANESPIMQGEKRSRVKTGHMPPEATDVDSDGRRAGDNESSHDGIMHSVSCFLNEIPSQKTLLWDNYYYKID